MASTVNMTREQVVNAVRDVAERRADVVAPERSLRMLETGVLEVVPGDGSQVEDWLSTAPTDHAHGQVAAALNIPRKYYSRMQEEAPDLLARNVNEWLGRSDRSRLLRTLRPTSATNGGSSSLLRAYLSDRYLPLDHEVPMLELARAMDDPDVEYGGGWVDHERLSIRVWRKSSETEVRAGDVVRVGVAVQNSEVGSGALVVRPYVMRLVCTNGMMVDVGGDLAGLRRVHVGGQLGRDGEVPISGFFAVSSETVRAHSRAAALEARDAVRSLLAPEAQAEVVARLRRAASQQVDPDEDHSMQRVVEDVSERIGLTQAETEYVLERFLGDSEGGRTVWALANAVTAQAHDAETGARRDELEEAGWQVVDMTPSQWREVGAEVA